MRDEEGEPMPNDKGFFNYCPNAYKCMKGKSCALKHICHVPRPEKKKEVDFYAKDNGH